MKSKCLELLVALILILFASCKKDPLTITSNIFLTQENSTNHLKLEISCSASKLVHTETLNFTSDSILVSMKIIGVKEGTGDIHLYMGNNTTITAFYFNRDTLITDTIFFTQPKRAIITFRNYTGSFKYEMDGL